MKRLLIEGAELCNQDSNSVHRLMMYVDNNLATLHRELNEENFNRILEIVWNMLSDTLGEIIQANLDVSMIIISKNLRYTKYTRILSYKYEKFFNYRKEDLRPSSTISVRL